ncbi:MULTISPECIES: DUF6702 family protein [unclassified Novosphingobium]|uniref:DUF6702 family protein n=1 Tax=unclassified Novosphingobium TaxID=2644732 RepID=UPI0025F544C0|nr:MULTISPECIES: DUF6702 family protein [unclassified Novosphingobium]HQS69036.1 hypothetical protein [Novosphingobium sp.]
MMRLPASKLLAAAVLAGALVVPATAHRGHDAMSVVTLEPGGALTVSHRFEAHDLEPALSRIAPEAQASLDDPEAIAALKAYLQRRFAVSAGGKTVPLAFSTIEVGVRQVRVDYAGRVKGKPKALSVQTSVLRDVYPSQVNQVQVRYGKVVRTLRFAGSEAQTVSF